MLAPKKVKHRKQHKGRTKGAAYRGSSLAFGDFGLRALQCGWVTARQIEAGRVALMRHIKRGGKLWTASRRLITMYVEFRIIP